MLSDKEVERCVGLDFASLQTLIAKQMQSIEATWEEEPLEDPALGIPDSPPPVRRQLLRDELSNRRSDRAGGSQGLRGAEPPLSGARESGGTSRVGKAVVKHARPKWVGGSTLAEDEGDTSHREEGSQSEQTPRHSTEAEQQELEDQHLPAPQLSSSSPATLECAAPPPPQGGQRGAAPLTPRGAAAPSPRSRPESVEGGQETAASPSNSRGGEPQKRVAGPSSKTWRSEEEDPPRPGPRYTNRDSQALAEELLSSSSNRPQSCSSREEEDEESGLRPPRRPSGGPNASAGAGARRPPHRLRENGGSSRSGAAGGRDGGFGAWAEEDPSALPRRRVNGRNWRGFDGGARAQQQEGGTALSKVWGANRGAAAAAGRQNEVLPLEGRAGRLPALSPSPRGDAPGGEDWRRELGANLGGEEDPLEEIMRAQADFARHRPLRIAQP